jgi:hypothetical protein
MKVAVLEQFLRSLVGPLTAAGTAPGSVADLERACRALEAFRDKDAGELADFLGRAVGYERDGRWPSRNPSITGRLLDDPKAAEYALRVRGLLCPDGTPVAEVDAATVAELDRLQAKLSLPQIKDLASELGVTEPGGSKPVVRKKIVEYLIGKRPAVPAADPAVDQLAERLARPAGEAERSAVLAEAEQLTLPKLRALAAKLGLGGMKSKPDGMAKLRAHVAPHPARTIDAPAEADAPPTDPMNRHVEILRELVEKAKPEGAPFDEIEAELTRVVGLMDRDEAIEAARRIGVVRDLNSRHDAIDEIRRKVFAYKTARERVEV